MRESRQTPQIVTNTPRFPRNWRTRDGVEGVSVVVSDAAAFLLAWRENPEALLLVDCDPALTFVLAKLLRAESRARLIAIDLVLREPRSWWQRPLLWRKRLLLRRVDHFLNYFRDASGLARVYGIDEGRCSYIPFKANLPEPSGAVRVGEGSYVLALGRSLRDFDTYFAALERVPATAGLRAAIAEPDMAALREHGARFTRSLADLPAIVERLADSGGAAAQIRMITGAAVVVLPIVRGSLVASGISTCLNAMLYGKCVIASAGPGVSDIFTDELVVVPPEDPAALALAIERVWRDGAYREAVAARGHALARSWGGEAELYQRIVDRMGELYFPKNSSVL